MTSFITTHVKSAEAHSGLLISAYLEIEKLLELENK